VTEPPDGPPDRAPAHRDRSSVLQAFGLVLMVLGLGCLFLGGFTGVVALTGMGGQPGAPAGLGMAFPGIIFYVLLAGCFFAVGYGSLRLLRWARPLVLVLAWLWLLSGVVSLAALSLFLPPAMEASRPPGATAEVMSFTMGCAFLFFAFLYVILPGILITVYGNQDVGATLAERDPVPRWTDRCPTPVLGLSLVLGYAALCWLLVPLLPMASLLGAGGSGLALLGAVAALVLAALARGTFRLRLWAWWGVLGLWLLWTSIGAAFFRHGIDVDSLRRQLSLPQAQMAEMEKMGFFRALQGPELPIVFGACALAGLLYLFWVRKHFQPPAAMDRGEQP
jgi:hypothetical protein